MKWKKKTQWPEACIQADVSADTILERRMEEEKARQCTNFRKNGKHSSSLIYLKTSLIRFSIHLASCLQIPSMCNCFRRIKHDENPAAI